ncbi:hypothetical protein BMS3Bbin06_00322 [bacterium BMS3Bbin06]|nr:hypothetical protein BMS3Abin08_01066 [bacterium BMS3Abin08]GBE33807.1 hypothetical protein BMS3Bbin06_00322 [bacterium BMS3Bbin06]HDO36827.1 cell division protein ZapB [Nitrospirota bacterium]HDY70147.1 cell division protein ZapB [Nitrospirota bacterium]
MLKAMDSLFKDKEVGRLETLKGLDEKISSAIEKVRVLKEEQASLQRRVQELETLLNEKDMEIERLRGEKTSVKGQLEELLTELESIEI